MLKKFVKTVGLFGFVFLFIVALNPNRNTLEFFTNGFSFSKDWFSFQDSTKFDRLNKVLYLIQDSYVDPERINFSTMFESSLDLLSSNVTKLSVTKEGKKTVLNIDSNKKDFTTKVDTMSTLRNDLSDALRFIADNTQNEFKYSQLEEIAIDGVLDTLDPHSNFLSDQMYQEMQVGTSGKFGGLGIVIGVRESMLTVIAPIDETPASRAGIQAGDHITKIDGQTTTGMPLTDAVDMMRGPKGEPVTITVERKGWQKPKDFHLIRDIIRVESVEAALLPNDIGYVKLKGFQEDTTKQLKKGLNDITEKTSNGLKGLILDLRNNPGGLLDQAINVSDLFLEEGTIVTTVGLRNKMRETQKAEVKNTQPMYPMVIILNEGSASASEIVAGALQRNQRAIVIGQKSFGKGTVQTLYELPEKSALKLTVAKYLTPGDISIQSIGIGPDIQTVPVVIDKEQTTFFYSEDEHGEAELERHFTNDQKPVDMKPADLVEYLYQKPKEDQEAQKEYSFGKLPLVEKQKKLLADFEVGVGENILVSTKDNKKESLIDAAKKTLDVVAKVQNREIAIAMQKQGVDWSIPNASDKKQNDCKAPEISFSVIPPVGQQVTLAGDKIAIEGKMKNVGACVFYQARGTSKSDSGFFDHREIFFGKVLPQQTVVRKIDLTVPKYQPAGSYNLNFKFDEFNQVDIKPQDLIVSVMPNKHPVFAFEYDIDDQIAGQSGFISPHTPERGEKFYLKLKVKNIGDVESKEAIVSIKQEGKALQMDNVREKLPLLKPGDAREVKFLIQVAPKVDDPTFNVTASISDFDFQAFIQKKIKFDLFQAKVAEQKKTPTHQYFQEPVITISNLNQLLKAQGNKATIEGLIKDDIAVQDIYIMVNSKKTTYHAFKDSAKSENFSFTVPLKKGKNEVILVARDNDDVIQTYPLNIVSQQ